MKLLYFAWVRQKIGIAGEDFALPQDVSDVRGLVEILAARGANYTEAFRDLAALRCAVNQTHSGFDTKISNNDEVAFFPPVTGG